MTKNEKGLNKLDLQVKYFNNKIIHFTNNL
jgi:hypothetical protein